jgi:hypothetical protein
VTKFDYPGWVDNLVQGKPFITLDVLSLGVDKSWDVGIVGLAPILLNWSLDYTRTENKG